MVQLEQIAACQRFFPEVCEAIDEVFRELRGDTAKIEIVLAVESAGNPIPVWLPIQLGEIKRDMEPEALQDIYQQRLLIPALAVLQSAAGLEDKYRYETGNVRFLVLARVREDNIRAGKHLEFNPSEFIPDDLNMAEVKTDTVLLL